MSVNGEFARVLGAFVELLESADVDGAERCVATLRAIGEGDRASWGGRGLEAAARRVLSETRPGGAIAALRFRRAGERERFEADTDHLVTLCRAITGEPAP